MDILISLLVIVAIAAVALWLVRQIPFPAGLEILQMVLVAIIVVMALLKVLQLW